VITYSHSSKRGASSSLYQGINSRRKLLTVQTGKSALLLVEEPVSITT